MREKVFNTLLFGWYICVGIGVGLLLDRCLGTLGDIIAVGGAVIAWML